MKRRDFGKVLTVGTIGAAAAGCEKTPTPDITVSKLQKNLKMHISSGVHSSEKGLTFLERMGVKYKIDGFPTDPRRDVLAKLSLDKILSMKDQCAKHNIILDGLHQSNPISSTMRGDFEKGDKEIDVFCDNIMIAAKAGIRVICIDLKETPNQRTERTTGRGGNTYSSWDMEKDKNRPNFYDTVVTADQCWERITRYLERVIPVATEYKVQIACHPSDPWLPPGFRGVDRVLGGFEGFKRYIEISPSPYHGLQICLGCMAESCVDPAKEVPGILQYFSERNKLFDIHYRNIIGGRNNFAEVYPDEGLVNMHQLMQILRDTQYPYGIDYDHSPQHADDPGSYQAAAFQIGYIQAMIQAVNDEV
ncbi:mannonate dehydratase [Candidatus Latescibacterota bacterium]